MILHDWSEAWRFYRESRKRLGEGYWSWRNARIYWLVWAASLGVALACVPFVIGMWTQNIKMIAVGMGVSLLIAWGKQIAIQKALAKKFPLKYSTYGLAQYPRSTRLKYCHYALFLDELVDQGYSRENVAQLSGFADIAKPPDMPKFQLSQYPGIMFLLGMSAPLLVSFVTNSPTWKSASVVVIIIILQVISLGVAIIPSWHTITNLPKHEHLTLQRFLQWAERDIEEAKALRAQRLRMELPSSYGHNL
jgi:hypothetical protein